MILNDTCQQGICVGIPDIDGDGWVVPEDCDELRYSVNPDAHEICNDMDDNCDGQVDNECTRW